LFNETPAPLLWVGPNQVNTIVPYSLGDQPESSLQIDVGGIRSNALPVAILPASPAIFSGNGSGVGPVLAINQDGSLNSTSQPAPKSSVLTFYATGLGVTNPVSADGVVAPPNLPLPWAPVAVEVGGVDAEVTYAGAAPGFVVGLAQINVRVPTEAPAGGLVPLVLRAGAFESQAGMSVFIQ
jgi:uncharacterized protein (TIGR03437 family)